MSDVNTLYLLQNQDKLFLNKAKEWADATELSSLYRARHKDEAINVMVEVNSKDIQQRIRCFECESDEKGRPVIDPTEMPEPLPKKSAEPILAQTETSEVSLANPDSNSDNRPSSSEANKPQAALAE